MYNIENCQFWKAEKITKDLERWLILSRWIKFPEHSSGYITSPYN